jgi:DNA polymerase I-like protein with 3'-5' exonuclease and polymerase domains
VFALGPDSLAVLQEMGVVPKNRKIGSMRARVLTLPNDIPVMVSYSPGIKEVDYGMFITLLTDTGMVARLAATGSIEPKLGEYRYVEHFQEIQQRIIALYCKTQQPVPVALDLETVGLDEYKLPDPATGHPGAYIVSIQVTCEPGKSDVVYFDNAKHEQDRLTNFEFAQRLSWLLSSPMISLRGANLKYDLRWLAKRGDFTCTNFKLDTTLVGSLLDENRINGLDVHTKIYVPSLGGYSDVFDQTVDKARMDLVPREKLLPYAGGDTDADWQVADKMKVELLEDPALAKFYVNILHPAARAFELVERGGIFIDPEKFRALESDLETEALKIVHKAKQIVGGRLVAKHQDEEKAGGLNITKASFINDYMFSPMGLDLKPMDFTAKSGKPSTSLDSLMKFKDIPEATAFIELLGEYGSLTKTLGTYVRGFMKCVRSDGKFHPNYFFFVGDRDNDEGGADTGRLSVKNPAVQCMVGETLVTTNVGLKRLDWLVQHKGGGLAVLTHTGKWQPIVGTYCNGIKKVYELKFSNGQIIKCTANHPVLTARGWVRTDELTIGDISYADERQWPRTSDPDIHKPNILFMDGYEKPLFKQNQQGLERLRGSWHSSMRAVAGFREFSCGFGGEARGRVVNRTSECEWQLRERQLPLGNTEAAGRKQTQYQNADAQWQNSDRGTVGQGVWNESREIALSAIDWDANGASIDESKTVNSRYFNEVVLISIEEAGYRETFDLTIQSSHSFVANGIVVHNTIPKHTKWTKRLRECYIAPPGYVIVERDYEQGELKVIACLANETSMIESYRNGMDLHVKTSAKVAGYTYDEMIAMKNSTDAALVYLYEETRQKGKAGNFGKIYGMGVEGFIEYARINYGVDLTHMESEEFDHAFFTLYPLLKNYHAQQKREAKKYKQVRGPLGRIRHLPLIDSPLQNIRAQAERQAINSPTQGALSDMMIWTFSECQLMLPQLFEQQIIVPCLAVHDAGYDYIREDKYEECTKLQLDIMQNLPFNKVGWNPQLQFTADAKYGYNLADMKKLKL